MDHTHNEEDDNSEMQMQMVVHDNCIPDDFTPGLLISSTDMFESKGTYFMYLTQSGQIQVSDFSHNLRQIYWSSCNGFLLEPFSISLSCISCHYGLMIRNPATNQTLALPPIMDPTQQPHHRFAIAYVASRMQYKVVGTYLLSSPLQLFQARINCAILTVGVDNSWRLVDTQHLPLDTCKQFNKVPLVTEGFVHWAQDWGNNNCLSVSRIITTHMSDNFVLTMNMETETISQFSVPECVGGYYYYKYLSSGESNLSLLIARGYLKWNLWEMKSETGEWSKLPDIDLESHKGLLNESYNRDEGPFYTSEGESWDCKLVPAGWLKYPDVIVFVVYKPAKGNRFTQSCVRAVYNVQTHDIKLLMMDSNVHPYLFHKIKHPIMPAIQC